MGILGGFVSGHRFSDASNRPPSIAPVGAGRQVRPPLAVILLALLFSTYALADTGADTYKTKCSACHGVNGAGDTMIGRNLKLRALGSADVQQQSDEELATIIAKGKNKMPAYDRKLSKDQIHDLVRYIRALKK
ncbi:MAG: c-type cytochrome [Terriglobales bacterium]